VLTVLLVDDEPALLAGMREMLQRLDCTVVTAADGDAAARLADRRPFDLVLTDVVMEGLVGTALLDHIRSSPDNCSTPLVFMSNMPEARVRSMVDGDYLFIHKPFTLRELRRLLDDIEAGHAMMPANAQRAVGRHAGH